MAEEVRYYDTIKIEMDLSYSETREAVEQRIKETEWHLELLDKVLQALERFDGHQCTKRIQTHLRKVLNHSDTWLKGIKIYARWQHSMFHVEIEDNDNPDFNKFSGLIAHESDPVVNMIKLRDPDGSLCCYHADKYRLPKYKRARKRVQQWVKQKDEILEQSQDLYSRMEGHELQYLFTK